MASDPYLAVTLDAKRRIDMAVRSAGLSGHGAVLWAVLNIWESARDLSRLNALGSVASERPRLSALHLRGCIGPDHRIREALGAFGILELHDDGGATVCDLGQYGTPPPRRAQPEAVPLVYFVRVGGEGPKIGFTNNLRSRLRSLQIAHTQSITVLATIEDPDPRRVEGALHKRFAHLRVAREWFRADPELLEYIRGLN